MPHFVELAEMDQGQDEKLLRDFGRRLKKTRLERKLSLRELAHLADMNHGNIALMEQGKKNPGLLTLLALAEALQVDPADLVSPK